jgi:hypothetical protein
MKFILIFFMLVSSAFSQELEINWGPSFQKELSFTCGPGETFCEQLCHASSSCVMYEGFCRNCIGTGIEIYSLFQEIGQTIRTGKAVHDFGKLIELLKSGRFASFGAREVYNVIDAYSSLRVLQKFEKLCPEGSDSQILFVGLTSRRALARAEYIFCAHPEGSRFYQVLPYVPVEVNYRKLSLY